jgi:hypothetical protein
MLNGNRTEIAKKEANLIPEFAEMCRRPSAPVVIVHQDAFAADYQNDEYRLLGMAIKFAGICGKEVRVIGMNRNTVDLDETTTH